MYEVPDDAWWNTWCVHLDMTCGLNDEVYLHYLGMSVGDALPKGWIYVNAVIYDTIYKG